MLPPPRLFNPYGIWIELAYALIVVVSCLFIYFRTKELYDLTSHKGVKFFRSTFLFFGMAYLIRFLMHLTSVFRLRRDISESMGFGIFDAAFFLMAYFSTIALIYLICSIFWKGLDRYIKGKIYILHVIAISVALVSVNASGPFILFGIQSLLFILLIAVSIFRYFKDKRKTHSGMYLLYLLIFALWIMSSIMSFVAFFSPFIGILAYLLSVGAFIMLLLKVMVKLKHK